MFFGGARGANPFIPSLRGEVSRHTSPTHSHAVICFASIFFGKGVCCSVSSVAGCRDVAEQNGPDSQNKRRQTREKGWSTHPADLLVKLEKIPVLIDTVRLGQHDLDIYAVDNLSRSWRLGEGSRKPKNGNPVMGGCGCPAWECCSISSHPCWR